MTKRIEVTTPNGGSTIEINESELSRFEAQGFKKVTERSKPVAKPGKAKSEVSDDGDV
jgi:hypothetical protein